MSLNKHYLILMGALMSAVAHAAELKDCQISMLGTPPKYAVQARFFQETTGDLKNGTENNYQRDDPVLNLNIQIIRTLPVIVPNADVTFKSSVPLVASYSLGKDVPVKIFNEANFADGRKFGVIESKGPLHLFFSQNFEFCNKAYQFKGATTSVSLGTFTQIPDDVQFERSTKDEVVKSGSLRIIYLGTTAGALKLAEIWVQGSKISRSITRTYDQFAKTIEIAGFKFDIIEAKGDNLRLRYDIPNRSELSLRALNDIPF
jgi:hypothetical protein